MDPVNSSNTNTQGGGKTVLIAVLMIIVGIIIGSMIDFKSLVAKDQAGRAVDSVLTSDKDTSSLDESKNAVMMKNTTVAKSPRYIATSTGGSEAKITTKPRYILSNQTIIDGFSKLISNGGAQPTGGQISGALSYLATSLSGSTGDPAETTWCDSATYCWPDGTGGDVTANCYDSDGNVISEWNYSFEGACSDE